MYDNMFSPSAFEKRESFPGDVSAPLGTRNSFTNPADNIYLALVPDSTPQSQAGSKKLSAVQTESVYMDMEVSQKLRDSRKATEPKYLATIALNRRK